MKLRLICILLFYCAGLSASGQQPTKEGEVTKPLTSPMALLQEADLISRDFVPEERANSLLELAQAANSLDTEAADRWSNELFRLTKQLKSGQFRAAMQKNALTVIAKNDPDLAAAMYSQLDPPQDWGNDLLLEDFRAYGARNAPKLDVGAKLNVAGSATMPGTNASPADVRSAIDEHRLMQVEDLESSDPRQAAHVAISIADLPLRAIALSQLAASYSSIDPSQSKNWLDQSEKELEALPTGTMKLRLLVSLASSAFELRQTERGVRFMSRAFDLGEELFEEDSRANPGKMAYNLDGAEQLQKLSTIATRYLNDPTVVVQRIQEIRPDLLKATLLTSAAAGIGEARQVPQG